MLLLRVGARLLRPAVARLLLPAITVVVDKLVGGSGEPRGGSAAGRGCGGRVLLLLFVLLPEMVPLPPPPPPPLPLPLAVLP